MPIKHWKRQGQVRLGALLHFCFLSSVQTIWLKLNVFAENQLTDIHSRRGTFFQRINQLILYWHLPPSLIFQEVPHSFSMLWLKNTVLSHGIKIIQCSGNSPICLNLPYIWRGVRSDAQLSSTETRFQKCSHSGKNGSEHPMLSISMAYNMISCKKVERNTQKLKIADFTM